MHLLLLLRAGFPPIMTVGDPGAQGAVQAGTQGWGVKTPDAAAVAAATVGLDMELHIPKVMGSLGISMMVAASALDTITVDWDVTGASGQGAAPKVH